MHFHFSYLLSARKCEKLCECLFLVACTMVHSSFSSYEGTLSHAVFSHSPTPLTMPVTVYSQSPHPTHHASYSIFPVTPPRSPCQLQYIPIHPTPLTMPVTVYSHSPHPTHHVSHTFSPHPTHSPIQLHIFSLTHPTHHVSYMFSHSPMH